MDYLFNYTITAKCHLLKDCLGSSGIVLNTWSPLGQDNSSFLVDEERWLLKTDDNASISGFYDPDKVGEKNYSFVVPITVTESTDGAVGVVFRVQDKDNYYAFLWDTGEMGWSYQQRLVRVYEGSPTILAERTDILPVGSSVLVKVQTEGARVRVFVGDKQVFDYTDTVYPIFTGSYGIAAIKAKGARFAGIYREYVKDENISRLLNGTLDSEALGIENNLLINSSSVATLLSDVVTEYIEKLDVEPDELVTYGYSVFTTDIFAKVSFSTNQFVDYTRYGNCYIYAYLAKEPVTPEMPSGFKGELKGLYIQWSWDNVEDESAYILAEPSGKIITSIPANTTSCLEKIAEDGTVITRRLWAYNTAGNSPYVEASIYVPIINPGPVSNFNGQVLSAKSILWSWSELEYAERYELLAEDGRVIASIPAGTNSYQEDNLESDRYHTRRLRAIRKGVTGPEVTCTTGLVSTVGLPMVPPPLWFKGEAVNNNTIRWFWEYNGEAAGFTILDIAGTVIAEVDGNTFTFVENNLTFGKSYVRLLIAKDSGGRISTPLTAECVTGVQFVPDECPVIKEAPALIPGFESGIGDSDDLLTTIEQAPVQAKAVIKAIDVQSVEEEVVIPANGRVRFIAKGKESVTKNYGEYQLVWGFVPNGENEPPLGWDEDENNMAIGVVSTDHGITVEVGADYPEEIESTVVRVMGDTNISVIALPQQVTIMPGEQVVISGVVRSLQVRASLENELKDWNYTSAWQDVEVAGETYLRPNIPYIPSVTIETIEFQLEGENINALFLNGDSKADSVLELLRVTGGYLQIRTVERPVYTSNIMVNTSVVDEAEVSVTVPLDENWQNYDWECTSLTPGVNVSIVDVNENEDRLSISVRFNVLSPAYLAWRPVTRSGFYYYQGQERFLFGDPRTNLKTAKPQPVTVLLTAHGEDWQKELVFTTEVPQDGQYHTVYAGNFFTLFAQAGIDASTTEYFTAKALSPDNVDIKYNSVNFSQLAVCLNHETDTPTYSATLDEEFTAHITPAVVGISPVIVTLADGTPLRPVCDTGNGIVIEETLHGNGSNYLPLAFNDIDEETVTVLFRSECVSDCAPQPDESEEWYRIDTFQVCGSKLKLPLTVLKDDVIKISYCLNDSFVVNSDKDKTIIKVHSKKVKPGDTVYVYYETDPTSLRVWDTCNLNPLEYGHSQGFIKIAPANQAVASLEILPAHTTISTSRNTPLYVLVSVTSNTGTGVGGAHVTLICSNKEPQSSITYDSGIAFFSIDPPFREGEMVINAFCETVQSQTTVMVVPADENIELDVFVDKHVLYPQESATVKVRVWYNGTPAQKLEVSSQGVGIQPATAVTDKNGIAIFTFTAPVIGDLYPVTLTCKETIKRIAFSVQELTSLITVENRVIDIPSYYTVDRLGDYDVITVATTPPEWL